MKEKSDALIIFNVIFSKIFLFAIIAVSDKGKFNSNLSNLLYNLFNFVKF